MDADELRRKVLEECHGVLRGSLDRVVVDVTFQDGASVRAFAHLPDRLLLQTAGAPTRVIAGDESFAVVGAASEVVHPADAARLRAVRWLLDAATLGPLYRADESAREDGALRVRSGLDRFALHLRPGTLLPERLQGPHGEVRFLSHLGTGATWMAERVSLADLGECSLRFQQSDLHWQPGFFDRPAPPKPDARPRSPAVSLPGASGEHRPTAPEPGENRAMSWVVVDDPGGWPERAAVFRTHHDVLQAQDQQLAGFTILLRENGRARMAIPFRARNGGPAFAAPAGWTVRDLPAQRVLLVFPEGASIEERIARGEELLRNALQERGDPAAGPILAQPYLHLQEGVPPADKVAAAVVRMSVALR